MTDNIDLFDSGNDDAATDGVDAGANLFDVDVDVDVDTGGHGGGGGGGGGANGGRSHRFSLATNLEQGLQDPTSFADAVLHNLPEIQECRAILQKPTGKRTLDDISFLKNTFKRTKLVDFFTNLDAFKVLCVVVVVVVVVYEDDDPDNVMWQIDKLYQSLELAKYFTKGMCVFEEGELGENFYLVFSGSVLVLLGHRPDANDFSYPEINFDSPEGHARKGFPLRTLYAGESFGERALIFPNERRSASVITSTDITELVFVNRVVFTTLIQETQDISSTATTSATAALEVSRHFRSNKDIVRSIFSRDSSQRSERDLKFAVEYLKGVKFFARFAFEVRKELCKVMRLITANTNTVLFAQGQIGKHFYILFTGKVDVSVETVNRFEAKTENVVTTLCEGDCFGELALLEEADGIRRATVQCCEFCELLVLSKDEFGPLIKKHSNEYHAQYAHLLKHNSYFIGDEWDDTTIMAMCNVMSEKFFTYKSEICKQGSRATEMFLVTRGECVVLHEDKHPITGEPVKYQLGRFGPNSVLGCAEASGGKFHDILLRDYSIVAESPVKLLVLSRFDIFHLMTPEARASLQRSSRGFLKESIASRALKTLTWEKYRTEYIEQVLTDAARCGGNDPNGMIGRGSQGRLQKLSDNNRNTRALKSAMSTTSLRQQESKLEKKTSAKTLSGSASSSQLSKTEDVRTIINRVITTSGASLPRSPPSSMTPPCTPGASSSSRPPIMIRPLVAPGTLNLEQCRRFYRKKAESPDAKAKGKSAPTETKMKSEKEKDVPSQAKSTEPDSNEEVQVGEIRSNSALHEVSATASASRVLQKSKTEVWLRDSKTNPNTSVTQDDSSTSIKSAAFKVKGDPPPLVRDSSSKNHLLNGPKANGARRSSLPAIQLSPFQYNVGSHGEHPEFAPSLSSGPPLRKLGSSLYGTSPSPPGTASSSSGTGGLGNGSSSGCSCPALWKPVHGIAEPFVLVGFRRDKVERPAGNSSTATNNSAPAASSIGANIGNGAVGASPGPNPNVSTSTVAVSGTRLGSARPNQEHHESSAASSSSTSNVTSSTLTLASSLTAASTITAFRVLGKYHNLTQALAMFRYVCSFETFPSRTCDISRFAIYKDDEMTMALENFFSDYHLEDQCAAATRSWTMSHDGEQRERERERERERGYEFRVTDLTRGTYQRFACISVLQSTRPIGSGNSNGIGNGSNLENVFVHVYQCFPTSQSAVRFAKQMAASNLATLNLLIIPLFEWIPLQDLDKFDAKLVDVEQHIENLVARRATCHGSTWKARKEAARKCASTRSSASKMTPTAAMMQHVNDNSKQVDQDATTSPKD